MTVDQWAAFRRKFPDAAAWIDRTDLMNEHARLRIERGNLMDYQERHGPLTGNDAKRLTWTAARLREVDALPMFATPQAKTE